MKLWEGQRGRVNFIAAILFLLPNLLGFLCFTAGPVALSLYMSFTNWSLKKSIPLEGIWFRNYIDLFTDSQFWFYLYNTFYFMIGIPFGIAGSLFLANLLVDSMYLKQNRKRVTLGFAILGVGLFTCALLFASGSKDMALILAALYVAGACGVFWGSVTFRTMFYIPSFASGVATIILWTQIFNPYHGMANGIMKGFFDMLGISADYLPMWLVSTKNLLGFLPLPESFNNGGFGLGAREAIMIMGFWMGIGGNNMILYIASISNIPESLYEAADIDGAGSFSKFIHITIPSVAPTTFFIAVMATIGGLQGGFQFAKIMTAGGPAGITTTLAYYIYTAGFEELNFGYASAVSWVMFTLVFTLTLLNWKYGNRRMEA